MRVESIQPAEVATHGEAPVQKESYPRLRLTEKEKITANQRLAMRIAPLGDKEMVATQSVGYTPTLEYTPTF